MSIQYDHVRSLENKALLEGWTLRSLSLGENLFAVGLQTEMFPFPISPTLSSFLGSNFISARPIWSRIDRLDLRPKVGPNSFRVVLSVPIKQSLQRKLDSLQITHSTQSPRSWVRFLVSSDFMHTT